MKQNFLPINNQYLTIDLPTFNNLKSLTLKKKSINKILVLDIDKYNKKLIIIKILYFLLFQLKLTFLSKINKINNINNNT